MTLEGEMPERSWSPFHIIIGVVSAALKTDNAAAIEPPCTNLQGISILKVRTKSYSFANPAARYAGCAHCGIHASTLSLTSDISSRALLVRENFLGAS
jgi:hypothetical protein